MDTNYALQMLVRNLLLSLPVLFVAVVGAILAVIKWRAVPRPSLFVMLGCLLILGSEILHIAIPSILTSLKMSNSGVANAYLILGAVTNSAVALGIIFLIVAAFSKRKTA